MDNGYGGVDKVSIDFSLVPFENNFENARQILNYKNNFEETKLKRFLGCFLSQDNLKTKFI